MDNKGIVLLAVTVLATLILCGALYLHPHQMRADSSSSITMNSSMEVDNANNVDGPGSSDEQSEMNRTAANQSAFTIQLEKPPFVE